MLFLFQWSRGRANNRRAGCHIPRDKGVGTDHGTFADGDRRIGVSRQNSGTGPDIHIVFNNHPAIYRHTWGKRDKITHNAVMGDVTVHIRVKGSANSGVRCQHGKIAEDGTGTYRYIVTDNGCWRNDGKLRKTILQDLRGLSFAKLPISKANRYLRRLIALQCQRLLIGNRALNLTIINENDLLIGMR